MVLVTCLLRICGEEQYTPLLNIGWPQTGVLYRLQGLASLHPSNTLCGSQWVEMDSNWLKYMRWCIRGALGRSAVPHFCSAPRLANSPNTLQMERLNAISGVLKSDAPAH